MTRRVFVHVGAPKTGTTYLQQTLTLNPDLLAAAGLSYPETRSGTHFEAAVDLLGLPWGGVGTREDGAWPALVAKVKACPGDVIVSHEVLASATREQAAKALADLDGFEVHLIYTVRDLARQIPAEWQETVKHRGRMKFVRFVRDLVAADRVDSEVWFWRVQGLPDVIRRWAGDLPAERIHVITVPPPGSDPGLLWRRFAGVLGIDPDREPVVPERANESMGVAETELIRRLNVSLRGKSIPQPVYATTVRDLVVHQTIAGQALSPRATVPPKHRAYVEQVTAEWQAWLAAGNVDLVGEVDDLTPRWTDDSGHWHNPAKPDPDAVIAAAVLALDQLVAADADRYRATRGTVAGKMRSRLRRVLSR